MYTAFSTVRLASTKHGQTDDASRFGPMAANFASGVTAHPKFMGACLGQYGTTIPLQIVIVCHLSKYLLQTGLINFSNIVNNLCYIFPVTYLALICDRFYLLSSVYCIYLALICDRYYLLSSVLDCDHILQE